MCIRDSYRHLSRPGRASRAAGDGRARGSRATDGIFRACAVEGYQLLAKLRLHEQSDLVLFDARRQHQPASIEIEPKHLDSARQPARLALIPNIIQQIPRHWRYAARV